MTHITLLLCLLLAVPADAAVRQPRRSIPRDPRPISTRPAVQPEHHVWICSHSVPLGADMLDSAAYADTLACLGWVEMGLAQVLRTTRIPARECPQYACPTCPGKLCCTNYGNNWCDCGSGGPTGVWCDCDGIYLADHGSGPGPRRIAGTVEWCATGPVIVVPERGGCDHDAWKHELIHLLRWERGDPMWSVNDSFWGWGCQ